MKKSLIKILAIICFSVLLLTGLFACVDKSKAELLLSDGITIDGTTARISVSNATEEFLFNENIKVSEYAEFTLSYDEEGEDKVEGEKVLLNVGDNAFYLTVKSGDGKNVNVYSLNIHRRQIFTVSFETGINEVIESQTVEEDSCAEEPKTLTRAGYDFAWDYDFSKGITSDITVSAVWTARTDTPYKAEYYFKEDENTLSLEKEENFVGTTDTLAEIEISDYDGYTFMPLESERTGNIDGDGGRVLKMVYWKDELTKFTHEGKIYDVVGENKIELISDKDFSTGINVLGLYPSETGRTVMGRLDYEGTAEDNSNIDPWTYAQWYATPSIINLEDGSLNGTYREDGDYIYYENDCKTIRINKSENEVYLGLDATKIDSQYVLNIEWPHALMEKEFSYSPRFSELESMQASMNFCVENYHKDYGTAVQVTWWFFVTDRDYDEDDGTNDCWLGFTLFDSRWDKERVTREETEMKLSWEQNTKDATVKVARSYYSDVLAYQTEVGKEYTVSFDIKELFGVAIKALRGKYPNFNVDPENFRILNFNIGWEMPFFEGQVGVRVSDISLVAETK